MRDGNILIEMKKNCQGIDAFQYAIASSLEDNGTIKSFVPKLTVEVRDLEVITTEADVQVALERELETIDKVRIHVTKPISRAAII